MSQIDTTQNFLIEKFNTRGVISHLNKSYTDIVSQHSYPEPVKNLLGEVLLAASLLIATIKLKGRMTLQFQSEGAIKMLVAQINDQGHLRGLAQWNTDASLAELATGLRGGQLVITIFQESQATPYQSIIPLEYGNISKALEYYFLQSEQLPTQFFLFVHNDHAVGMLLQMLPAKDNVNRELVWQNLIARMQQVDLKTMLDTENLVFLQFQLGDQDIRVFDSKSICFQCSCSIEKMKNAVFIAGEQEAESILKDKQQILVICEYCNHQYGFNKEEVQAIFSENKK